MSGSHAPDISKENTSLDGLGSRLFTIGAVVGLLGLAAAAGLAAHDGALGWQRFRYAYLVSFLFFLSISLGALFFVAVQHLTRAGWSVSVRRLGELLAGNMLTLALLSLVILVPMLLGDSSLYTWVDSARAHADHILQKKVGYLNVPFFTVRCAIYFGFWIFISRFFLKHSAAQDTSGDPTHTSKMERLSAPTVLLFALTLTFAAFDFIMSLDPYWFSTIFGVYFFAGSALAFFAAVSLLALFLQRSGRLLSSISTEHYHDLGKFLFAFIFFWGYIAFSQFMLIWYADVPEETVWFQHRIHGGWGAMSVVLIFGHFIIPFAGLLSRHVKRNRFGLGFWAVYMLAMHWIDIYWLVMPNLDHETVLFGLPEVLTFVGLAGLFVAGFARLARGRALVPLKDPRLAEALSFENI